jgi:hypothetical protein
MLTREAAATRPSRVRRPRSLALPYGDLAKSYPLKMFRDGGPHTISFSGSKRFSSTGFIEQSLDYDWKVELTFLRI